MNRDNYLLALHSRGPSAPWECESSETRAVPAHAEPKAGRRGQSKFRAWSPVRIEKKQNTSLARDSSQGLSPESPPNPPRSAEVGDCSSLLNWTPCLKGLRNHALAFCGGLASVCQGHCFCQLRLGASPQVPSHPAARE